MTFEKSASDPVLSLIIPVFNEARHLGAFCEFLFDHDFGVPTEFVFVDDCSTDGSRAILRKYATRPNVVVLEQSVNGGKGRAIQLAAGHTRGDVVVIQDADFEYSPADIPTLIRPILDDEADVVFGSRYKNSTTVHRTFHYAVNRFLTLLSNLFSGLYLSDMETCYKAFRGEILRNMDLQSPRFGIEPELTAHVAALQVRIAEVPVRYVPRSYLQGKKIRWTDGVAAVWFIARYNLDRQGQRRAVRRVPEKYQIDRS